MELRRNEGGGRWARLSLIGLVLPPRATENHLSQLLSRCNRLVKSNECCNRVLEEIKKNPSNQIINRMIVRGGDVCSFIVAFNNNNNNNNAFDELIEKCSTKDQCRERCRWQAAPHHGSA